MLNWQPCSFNRGGVIFAVKWDPRKISPRTEFVTHTPTYVEFYRSTDMSVKHVAAAVASLRKLRGSTLFLNSACCCRCLVLRETASLFRLRVRAPDESVPPTSASITTLQDLTNVSVASILVQTGQLIFALCEIMLAAKI